MRLSFHKSRDKRYQIALEELRKTFQSNQGEAILADLRAVPLRKLTKDERFIARNLRKIHKCLRPSTRGEKRKHGLFLNAFRKTLHRLNSSEIEKNRYLRLNRLLLELCKTKFYRVHLFAFGHDLLREMFTALAPKDGKCLDYKEHFSQHSFLDESLLIIRSRPTFLMEREVRRFNESLNQSFFDPHKYNHPFLLYTFAFFRQGRVRRLKMVRMGSPTKEGPGRPPKIIEEFKGFLTLLKQEKKVHLYINKQKTWGKEGLRSLEIQNLELEYDNFYCISLPSDGAFYYQEMSYASQHQASKFKQTFQDLLMGKIGVGYYHLPQSWLKSESFEKDLCEILEQVHECYFDSKELLTVTERRFFIDHVYTQIIITCLQNFKIDSLNITCRDGIDRAGCEQAKLLYYFQTSLGIENDLDSMKERQFLLHIPPYLAKIRPMIKERREYLHQLIHVSYNKEVCRKICQKGEQEPLLYLKPHFVKRSLEGC